MKIIIYSISTNNDNSIIYVGQTIDILKRFKAHKVSFGEIDISYSILEEIEVKNREEARVIEYRWINKLFGEGQPLVNVRKKIQDKKYDGIVILTRGVPLMSYKKLVRIAKKNKCSVNYLMLHAIEFYISAASFASSEDYLMRSLRQYPTPAKYD